MEIEPSSFKDPCAFVYIENGNLFRRFSKNYIPVYQKFINSGLYERLIKENLIIPHEEISSDTIKPEKVFISYPWEWCFSQLKDAALAVLKIQNIALDYDMTLKDANCFNMQFYNNKPVLIDTSSFENYTEGEPWTPYKQFCENFLAPLALTAYKDICLSSLLLLNINGIPLELTSKLLPLSSKFNLNLFTHIHLHSRLQNKYSDKTKQINKMFISKLQLKSIIDNLIKSVENIKLKNAATQWENYYTFTNYEEKSFQLKKNIINNYKNIIRPEFVLDFGSNTGVFSRIFSEENIKVLALDFDRLAVEKNYLRSKELKETNIFPMVFDIVNPSPALGWANQERKTLPDRVLNADLILSLALIHHLRFTYNIPFYKIAEYFSGIAEYLIIEFVDKKDSQVQKMLLNRKDVFDDYYEENFETEFNKFYNIKDKNRIIGTERTLYLMKRK